MDRGGMDRGSPEITTEFRLETGPTPKNASQMVDIEQWKEGWPHNTHGKLSMTLMNC